ncbi:hypothetical protein ONZ45_g15669 [Pleurotus djamor]|nr:hypothetical protein ONZ45_g15669 [Pleurotus djamor]
MYTVTTTSTRSSEARLRLLADVAASQQPLQEFDDSDASSSSESEYIVHSAASSSASAATAYSRYDSPSRHPIDSLHISCDPYAHSPSPPKPFKRSVASNSASSFHKPRSISKLRDTQKSRQAAVLSIEKKLKQQEVKERAQKIRTVENSPVNQQQLLVLRMVYDQITMYPSETWMAIIAVTIRRSASLSIFLIPFVSPSTCLCSDPLFSRIPPPFSSHRALKQVKNWFSNERQKHTGKKDEDVVRMVSAEGERLRLRPIAVQSCKAEEWTDTFFEEVVMIHHLKVSTSLRLDESQHPRET